MWQAARELSRGVYRAAATQKLRNDPALATQMKRAATSIAGNIAEGYERGTRKQHIEFCYIAKGSAGELRSHVTLARDAGLLDETASAWLLARCEACSRMLSAYIAVLQRTRAEFPRVKTHGSRDRPATSDGRDRAGRVAL